MRGPCGGLNRQQLVCASHKRAADKERWNPFHISRYEMESLAFLLDETATSFLLLFFCSLGSVFQLFL